MESTLRKLTDEERQKVTFVMNDFFEKYILQESSDPKYITEYDVLMKEKNEAYKQTFLKIICLLKLILLWKPVTNI